MRERERANRDGLNGVRKYGKLSTHTHTHSHTYTHTHTHTHRVNKGRSGGRYKTDQSDTTERSRTV